MSKTERDAYAIAYGRALEADIAEYRSTVEGRVRDAIERAGAVYQSYVDRGDTLTVEYMVDGAKHRSVVRKDTLSVETAGICLDGGDRLQDLQSLIGVIRVGAERDVIHRTSINVDYDDY
jgi:hypothetical protein